MKVYCLFDGFYSDRYLFGVFATLEAAKAAFPHVEHQPDWQECERFDEATERAWSCDAKTDRLFGCGGWVEEREVVSMSLILADENDRAALRERYDLPCWETTRMVLISAEMLMLLAEAANPGIRFTVDWGTPYAGQVTFYEPRITREELYP